MTRVAIGSIMAAFGYLLVYAGIADGGKYAGGTGSKFYPWDALGA